jgi:hypothetical protein
MKVKNFPARKLKRQLRAQGKDLKNEESKLMLRQAREIRTKKNRSDK